MQTAPSFNWDDLKVLLVFLRAGGLKAAGRRLGVNPSTVSRRLAALEEALGARLFDRTPDGLVATAMTRALLPSVEKAEEAAADVVHGVSGRELAPEGLVRIALPEALAVHALIPILAPLRAAQPNITLSLMTGAQPVDLARLEADIAVRSIRPRNADLVFKPLATMHFRAFASAQYLARRRKLPAHELDWIWPVELPDHETSRWMARHLPDVRPALSLNSLGGIVQAVVDSLGVSLLPESILRRHPTLRAVEVPFPAPAPVPFWLVTHAKLRHVPRIVAVWDYLASALGEALSAS